MAINKQKNVNLQITMPKEDAENLKATHEALNENGIKCTKSDILTHAFRRYVKEIVSVGLYLETPEGKELIKQKAEEAKKGEKDA